MNILLTSAGRRSYLVKYFQEALGGKGLVHAGNSVYSPALQVADKAVITPLIYDSTYIDFLIEYCKKNNIKAILSLFDMDLPILAKSIDIFKKAGISVVVSDNEVIKICNDKWETYKFLVKNSFNTPRTFLKLADIAKSLDKREIEFPVIIKPRWGNGSFGVYEAANWKELDIFYDKSKRIIFNTYLSYESSEDPENCVLVQEKKTGKEYCMEVINNLKSQYINTFVKRKREMRGGEDQNAITEKNLLLEKTGKELSQALKHIASLDVDCFVSDGNAYVIEMNARFGGHYPFSHLAGANLPLAIIKWLKGEDVNKSLLEIKYGIEVVKDIVPIILKQSNKQ